MLTGGGADAGSSQVPPMPKSLLQKLAQDAKRRTLACSQGGQGLARDLSQAHSNAPAGALPSSFSAPLPPEAPTALSAGWQNNSERTVVLL